jgi:hypothetical protein
MDRRQVNVHTAWQAVQHWAGWLPGLFAQCSHSHHTAGVTACIHPVTPFTHIIGVATVLCC